MDFPELRYTLRRYAPVSVAAFVVCVLLGAAAAYLPSRTYVTSTSVAIDPGGPSGPTTPTTASVPQMNFALPSLQEKAQSAPLQEAAAADVPEELRDTPVSISAKAETSVLVIKGSSSSAEAAQAWVNAVADRLVKTTDPLVVFRLSIVDPARLPAHPISPKTKPIMAGAVVFGLIAAVFSALLARRIREVANPTDVVRAHAGAPVLGEIPKVGGLRKGRGQVLRMLEDETPREVVTAFETIRTNLEIQLAQRHATSLAVLSQSAGAGRSTVVAGLGYSLASVGRDVILIEADLRQPSLPEKLTVTAGRGLGGMAVLGDGPQVQTSPYRNLGLLAAGVPAGRAADVVSMTLPRAIAELASPSSVLIVDTPALQEGPEGALAAALARHVVVVVDATPEQYLQLPALTKGIEESGAVVLGVVINRVPRRRYVRTHRDSGRQNRSTAMSVEQVMRHETVAGAELSMNGSTKPEPEPARG